jgi:hypothetical protein
MPVKQAEMSSWRRVERVGAEVDVGGAVVVVFLSRGIVSPWKRGEGLPGAGVTAAHPVRPDRFEASSSSRRWKAYGFYTSRK